MFAGAKEKVLGTARRLVSQNKVRLKEDGFDLDLIYLTEQIICMGLPAQGSEALYRNPIDSVVRFLEKNHGGRYKVFNLCNERTYDISKFGDACASFPFDDHAEAIAFYNGRRTKDGRGLTVPSQRRYVYYYERVLRGVSFEGAQRTLRAVRLSGLPAKKVAKLSLGNSSALGEAKFTRLVVTIRKNGAAIPEAGVVIEIDPRLPLGAPHTARCNLLVSADLCVSLADEAGHELCKLWMHPNLEPEEACFVLANDKFRSEVDGYVGAHVGANEAPSIPSGGEVLEQPPPPPRAAYADNDAGDSPGAAQDTPGHSARDES
ncbi:phosphatidylinositol-3,4,5-trisphosphate 3-phosphatase [Chrysochromulina tobinii]|uniref:Phosphatidylinositol-3,4,5-trisphosphate 3-phosphatase n=1 Tax=Chrysochromulina tobinii TaxID=1460289 RepID=A0A0M0K6B5_9EUKA|nr:phosphatidylinositol-3,4,5-trisphosphate 3-phosphatase [Chrysochromulina tobinii]|eukprot:KOO34344.1 phosphatidylinositol-3,4,5-trisphosphate 3-phosphatase [Chrysochromulina sp. CCMP291]